MAKKNSSESMEIDSRLVRMCIDAATESRDAIEAWRRQRRTLERLPSQLADVLLHRLLRRRLLFPSLLEYVSHLIHFSICFSTAHLKIVFMRLIDMLYQCELSSILVV